MRIARLSRIPKDHSVILFGPRGVGKTTLLDTQFARGDCLWIDLLLPQQEARYARDPERLIAEVEGMSSTQSHVIIDEVQKVPKLFDVVHYLIERTDKHFVLTGSSARKIKRSGANLLAGRAFVYHLAPFSHQELGDDFQLEQALHYGLLPKIYSLHGAQQRAQYLKAYGHTYLKEEVWAEQFIKLLDPFRYFLEVAAQCNGKIINYSKIARDVGVDHKTVENYYTILEDTLLGFVLPAFAHSFRKQLRQRHKFYFFDVGVTRALARLLSLPIRQGTSYFGEVFEQFIIVEIHKSIRILQNDYRMSYLQTKQGLEIDLVIMRPGQKTLLIEIKSSEDVQATALRNLTTLVQDLPETEVLCFSRDERRKKFGDITVWPWQEGIAHYFSGDGLP